MCKVGEGEDQVLLIGDNEQILRACALLSHLDQASCPLGEAGARLTETAVDSIRKQSITSLMSSSHLAR